MRARSDTKLCDVIRRRNLRFRFREIPPISLLVVVTCQNLKTEMGRREVARTSYKIEISRDLEHGLTKLAEDIIRTY